MVEVLSPNRNKGKKRKFKQSKIQIHGEKNKLVVKLPEQDSESSSGPKKTQRNATSSPICIDLDSRTDKVQEVLAVVKVAVQRETVQREKLKMKYLKQRSQKRQKKN